MPWSAEATGGGGVDVLPARAVEGNRAEKVRTARKARANERISGISKAKSEGFEIVHGKRSILEQLYCLLG
jgi:hypothetical protein